MTDDLHLLLKLQEFDVAIDDLKNKAKSLALQIQSKTKDLEVLKTSTTAAKSNLQTKQARKKELELAVDEKEKIVKKHQTELNSLKSNDAYKAMLIEINNAKQEVTKIEDDILNVMESVEAAEKEYKAQEQKMKSQESVMKGDVQKLEGEKAAVLEAEKAKQAEREAYAQTVPEKPRTLYDYIREKRGTNAIVPMVESNCSGCRMILTPHQANEVRKRKNLVRCETCSRIVYLPEETSAKETPATPPTDNLATTSS